MKPHPTPQNKSTRPTLPPLAGLVVLLLAALLLSAALGRYPIHPWTVLQSLGAQLFSSDAPAQNTVDVVLYNVRFPRLVMAAFVGGGLALAGATFQALFQNPMVSPDVLGASSGAGFGAALAILMGFSGPFISLWAFLFGLVSLGLVLTLSKRLKQNKLLGLILTGIVVGSLFSAMLSWLKLVADPTNELPAITYWLMGSLNGVTKNELLFAIPLIVAGSALILLLRWQLNVMTLGDDVARSMGIDCQQLRLALLMAATLITATCVCVSGMIGWVGLVIPHCARSVVGQDHRSMLPASLIMGALFMVIIDDGARLLATSEIPLSILTAFVGAPFFLHLIYKETSR